MLHYINERYKPKAKDLVVSYYIEPNKVTIDEAAQHIAAESSIGTWTDVVTMNKRIAKRLKPSVFDINRKDRIIKIAYTSELFEEGNICQILSAIAGNIFGMKVIKNLRLLDIEFPKKIIKSFKGPRFGIPGIRKITKVRDRPLVGTIVKPKVGLTARQHAKVAYEAWMGGCDIVKDDENLTSMKFNKFKERIKLTLKAAEKAERETGEVKIYMPNITSSFEEMKKRAEFVKAMNGRYMMIDVVVSGFSALQAMRDFNDELNLVIHAHRAGHAALTRNSKHGITMLALAKIYRLIGVDQLHIGTAHVGKMEGSALEVIDIEKEIEEQEIYEHKNVLEQKWFDIKPVLAVASGGLHPGSVPRLIQRMGTNIVMQFGGGIHGHPQGTRKGAIAVRQALDATLQGISLEQAAKKARELAIALRKWGIVK